MAPTERFFRLGGVAPDTASLHKERATTPNVVLPYLVLNCINEQHT
jgi:hypothetical protein